MSKERLTERYNGKACCPNNVKCSPICEDCEHMGKMMDKLAEYEDLEEQGLLLRLPCKVGDTVYKIRKDVNSMKRETVEYNGRFYYRNIYTYFISQAAFEIEDISSLGETVFLTRAEAENKMKELEEGNGKEN